MAMMYKIIAKALEDAGLSDQYHPQEYLNFYCLGKREVSSEQNPSQINQQSDNRTLVCLSYLFSDHYIRYFYHL